MHEITQLLLAWSNGEEAALAQLAPLVQTELYRLAQRYLSRERAGHSLQISDLVNEAYVRLIDRKAVQWQNRAHFFGVAAQMMRRILVDYARSRLAAKRGSGGIKVSLDDALNLSDERAGDFIALDEALERLAEFDPQKSKIVELRFFGGLSVEEAAEVLGIGTATVTRQWKMAKAWLYQEVCREPDHQ